jgi:hypothetical protein
MEQAAYQDHEWQAQEAYLRMEMDSLAARVAEEESSSKALLVAPGIALVLLMEQLVDGGMVDDATVTSRLRTAFNGKMRGF